VNRRRLIAAAPLLLAPAAWAQTTVYRCGADGRTFSQTPCADAQVIVLKPGPGPQAQAEARAVAAREAALARQLADERRAREAAAARAAPRVVVRRPQDTQPTAVVTASRTDDRPSRRALVPRVPRPASGG
jgi:hypothetical protein